jgi:hypothetical protein
VPSAGRGDTCLTHTAAEQHSSKRMVINCHAASQVLVRQPTGLLCVSHRCHRAQHWAHRWAG